MKRWLELGVLCALLIGGAFVVAAQQAAYAPGVERGLAWLVSQVRADGTVAGERGSQALPVQVRTETLHTLSLFESRPAGLTERIAGEPQKHTELQARQLLALRLANRGAQQVLADLGVQQNADGGFGSRRTYGSNALDTAYALLALAATPDADPTRVSAALGYLRTSKLSQAGWTVGDHPSVYATSAVLLAAQGWASRYQVGDIIGTARDWLLAQRGIDGTYGNVLDNANALLALTTQTSDEQILKPLSTALEQAQLESGAWGDDPYVTAVALRALYRATVGLPATTTGAVAGTVVEHGTQAPLAGVTLTLRSTPDVRVESAPDGSFMLLGLSPGAHTIDIQALGYVSKVITLTVATGVTTNTGTIALEKTALTAEVFGVVRNSGGSALANIVVSSGTASTFTAADGSYSLKGLNAGPATVTFAAQGYRTLEVPLTLEAGIRYQLAPTLYTTSQTPPTKATIRGSVTNRSTGAALAGASVKVGSSTATSAANGTFEITGLEPGTHAVTASAAGFTPLAGRVTLVAGINNVGALALDVAPQSSTLVGLVSDGHSNAPIAGAILVVQGQTATTAAGPDGRYLLSGIQGTAFTLVVSAPGYASRTVSVTLPALGQGELNIELLPLGDSKITFDSVTTNRPVYRPSDEVELEIEVRNGGDSAVDLVIDAEVRDPAGEVVYVFKANARGLGQNPANEPLRFDAGALTEIELDWVLARQTAGVYTITARARDADGRVRAEGATRFTVDAMPVLAGAIIADPPLTQIDSDTPVHIRAELANLGNRPIAAGNVDLRITLAAADTASAGIARSTIERVASFPNQSMTRLDRDTQGNFYTAQGTRVNRIGADGTATVLATLPSAITDLAVQGDGTVWTCSGRDLRRVTAAGVVTRFPLVTVASCDRIDVNSNGVVLVGGTSALKAGEKVLVRFAEGEAEQRLWGNGLSQPVGIARLAAGGFAVANYGDGTISRVSTSGVVTPWAQGLNQPFDLIERTGGDLIVANSGGNNLIRVMPDGTTSVFASGLNQPVGLLARADGSLLVSTQGDHSVMVVDRDGQVAPYAQGFAHRPTGVAIDAAGAVLVANGGDGTLKALEDGAVRARASGLGNTGAVVSDSLGNTYVATTAGNVLRVAADGAVSTVATGLGSIGGLALQGDGLLHVSDANGQRIVHLDLASGAREITSSMLVNPDFVQLGASGALYIANTQFVSVRRTDGVVARLAAFNATSLSALPEGGVALVHNNTQVVLLDDDGRTLAMRTMPFHIYDMAARPNGKVVLVKYDGGYKFEELDVATGVRQVIAALPRNPDFLSSDGAGNLFYRSGSELRRLDTGGTDVSLPYSVNGESVQYLAATRDGDVLITTYSNRVYLRSTETGLTTRLGAQIGSVSGLARDVDGGLVATYSADNALLVRDPAGPVRARIDGFSLPRGLAWTGSALRLVDGSNRLYELAAPGMLPTRLASSFPATALTHDRVRDGTFGVGSGATLVEWRANQVTYHGGLPSGSYVGVASLGNGRLAVAEQNTSTVYVTQLGTVQSTSTGLVGPRGLALAPDGGVLVANVTSGTVVKLPGAGRAAELVYTTSSPRYVHAESDGTLWVSTASSMHRVAPNKSVTTLSAMLPGRTSGQLQDFVVDNGALTVVDYSVGVVKVQSGTTPTLLAGGLGEVRAVAWSATGEPLVLDGNSRAVFAVRNGALVQVHERVPSADHLSMDASGVLYTAGAASRTTRFANGVLQSLQVGALIGEPAFLGLVATSPTEAHTLTYAYNGSAGRYESTIYRITTSATPDPASVGQVVYTASLPIAELTPEEDTRTLDFGTWVPPYAGDFKIEVGIAGVEGGAVNFIHVGASALGTLTADPDRLPPGDQIANLRLDITGGDFTSLSRVEVARLRKVVGISFPSGITSDRAGNIYFTTGSALYRVGMDGVQSTLATGLSVRFGLAIDSQERLYFLQRNASGRYDLMRASLDGQYSLFAALDASSASGVAVDAQDQVFVAMPNRLVRISPAGAVSTVTTSGFPSPRGITIDGKGNVYVQNDNNLVAQVTPDGKVYQLYSGGDGVDNPSFEGDGYPNITADCSDNLYIATWQWQKINQSGEEHTIAQIVSRTGHVGLLVDTSRTVPRLTDIDYLAFDRFNNRLMLWDHSTSAIYSIPVTCGAISAEAHVFSLPGQTLSGFTVPPSASIPHADGRTEYVWSLRDVTAQGVSIDFAAPLSGLALGETRATLDSAYLTFHNTFTTDAYRVPLAVPKVAVDNAVGLVVATNRPEYAAHETVGIAAVLSNVHTEAVDGTLVIDILDVLGNIVDTVHQDAVTIAGGGSLTVPATYNVGSILPAGYTVRARLLDSTLNTAEATARFAVLATAGEKVAEATLALDRAEYDPTDRVAIASVVRNASSNVNFDELVVMVRVYDAAGVLQFTTGHDVGTLLHGATRRFEAAQALRHAPAGRYRVVQVLQDDTGRVFDTDEAEYAVRSTATTGTGLEGRIAAVPAVVTVGDPVTLDALATNRGNADFSQGELIVRVLDLANEDVVQMWEQPASVPLDGSQAFQPVWSSLGATPGYYGAALMLRVNGHERVLASTAFQVTPLKVKIGVEQQLAPGRTVLVLVSCQPSEQNSDPTCAGRKAQAVETLLGALELPHTVVKSVDEFRLLMRGGEYDAYWVSGGSAHLGHALVGELQEAVFRGDGLLVDGDHDSRNGLLNEVLGVKYQGKLPNRQHTVTMLDTRVFDAGQFDIRNPSVRFSPVGAATHGRFTNGDSAVLTYSYGRGHSATFAFDYVTTVGTSTQAVFMRQVLRDAIEEVLVDSRDGIAAGELIGIRTTVTNLAGETPGWLRLRAEAPLAIDGAVPAAAQMDTHQAAWRFDLAVDQRRQFLTWVRAPDADGTYAVFTHAGHGSQIGANVLATVDTPLAVVSSARLLQQAEAAIAALEPRRDPERHARDRALEELRLARVQVAAGQYAIAIDTLLRTRDQLVAITTIDVAPARIALSRYLAFVERRSTLQ